MIGVNFGTVLEAVMAACLRRVASKAVRLAGWRGRNYCFLVIGFWLKLDPAARRATADVTCHVLGGAMARTRRKSSNALRVVDFGARFWPL